MTTVSEKLPESIDLSHHLSNFSKARPLSPLKGLQKYWGRPGLISLAGGMSIEEETTLILDSTCYNYRAAVSCLFPILISWRRYPPPDQLSDSGGDIQRGLLVVMESVFL
jgi:hypothetical protein